MGHPFGPKWPIFLFYPKGLPTTCLMQIYHLGLNCRVSKNGPPFWAKVAHFLFLPQGPPNIMSDAELPFGVKLLGFQKWATLLGQSGPFSFFTPRISQQHVWCRFTIWGKIAGFPKMGHPFGLKWPIFLFYPKGLPTTCLMQIYHLG